MHRSPCSSQSLEGCPLSHYDHLADAGGGHLDLSEEGTEVMHGLSSLGEPDGWGFIIASKKNKTLTNIKGCIR